MLDSKLREVADGADMIVRGYAFTRKDGNISVLNINHPTSAMYMSPDGKMLESTMDEIEQAIVFKIWEKDSKYMEDPYACYEVTFVKR